MNPHPQTIPAGVPDEELMAFYQMGRLEAFEILYARYERRVMGYLKKRGLDDFEAEEVFQKVFFKFHQTRQKYRAKHPVSAWIFTIARSALLDFLRTDKKWREAVALEETSGMKPFEAGSPPGADAHEILSPLQKDERAAVRKRFLEEASYEEMAVQLGLSQEAVRQKVSRAVRKLKGLLTKETL